MPLLTPAANNAKTAKMVSELGIEAAILHLAPADKSGHNTCPMASVGCKMACLNTAGHGFRASVQAARIRKTRAFFADTPGFMAQLVKEIAARERKARKRGQRCAIRLNGTSDIRWETVKVTVDGIMHPNVMTLFPNVQFYDYTKIPNRRHVPTNYHLTFSLSECNDRHALAQLEQGVNVAVVLAYDTLPEAWNGYRVVDGDKHDYRFLDPQGPCIIALKAKGDAKHDTSGFVRSLTNILDATRVPVFASQIRLTPVCPSATPGCAPHDFAHTGRTA